jgi:putative copper export protein
MDGLWLHYWIVLLHISAGLFWMGWIVFMFLLLIPVLQRLVPERLREIQPTLERRVRKVVFWLILLIVATGLHNIYFTQLYDTRILLHTAYGHRFLIKLGAALVLFAIYFAAPFLTGMRGHASGNPSCCESTTRQARVVKLALHVVALVAGMTAALIGVSLGG